MANNVELAPLGNIEIRNPPEKIIEGREGIDDGLLPPQDKPLTKVPKSTDRRPLDINLYATKKTIAQGMMDLALLTANSNQLRYVLESGNKTGIYFYISVTLISLSIVLQLVVGVILIFVGKCNVTKDEHAQRADRYNNWVVLGVFFITVINVFVSAFTIDGYEIKQEL